MIKKTDADGILEVERRGGRRGERAITDQQTNDAIRAHINKFPRVESHYCRKDTSKMFLAADLTIRLMFEMYMQSEEKIECSFAKYYSIFKKMNLSFHKPSKDLCKICESYRSSNDEEKEHLEGQYTGCISEKEETRRIRLESKALSTADGSSHVAACFDFQQVIYLPKSPRAEIFYKRRLSNYNFTIYNLKDSSVDCFLWHEGISGS